MRVEGLAGRTALVTGGSRGIGQAVVELLAASGARVVLAARSQEVADVAQAIGAGVTGVTCDVSDEGAVEALVGQVVTHHGGLDVLVNCAGVNRDALLHRMTLEQFREVLDVNLVGTWLCTRAVLRHLRERGTGGAIVNVSSIAGKAGNFGQGNYAASKAGVVALTQTTAREGARFGVRANAVRPGFIDTDMTRDLDAGARERLLESVPMGRAGTPEEVAAVVAFLASPLAAYVTGAVVDVAGGRHM